MRCQYTPRVAYIENKRKGRAELLPFSRLWASVGWLGRGLDIGPSMSAHRIYWADIDEDYEEKL